MRREDQDDARALRLGQNAAQAKDDAALVLAQNLDGGQQINDDDRDGDHPEV